MKDRDSFIAKCTPNFFGSKFISNVSINELIDDKQDAKKQVYHNETEYLEKTIAMKKEELDNLKNKKL